MVTEDTTVFVNNQSFAVTVHSPDNRMVQVHPIKDEGRIAGAIFRVKGEHYRQFVSQQGPLWAAQGNVGEGASATVTGDAPTVAVTPDSVQVVDVELDHDNTDDAVGPVTTSDAAEEVPVTATEDTDQTGIRDTTDTPEEVSVISEIATETPAQKRASKKQVARKGRSRRSR